MTSLALFLRKKCTSSSSSETVSDIQSICDIMIIDLFIIDKSSHSVMTTFYYAVIYGSPSRMKYKFSSDMFLKDSSRLSLNYFPDYDFHKSYCFKINTFFLFNVICYIKSSSFDFSQYLYVFVSSRLLQST